MGTVEFKIVFIGEKPTLCDFHEDFIEGVRKVSHHKNFIKFRLEHEMSQDEVNDLFEDLKKQLEVPIKLEL